MSIEASVLKKYIDRAGIFIETGSHIGITIDLAIRMGAKEIHSIELATHHYQTCVKKFKTHNHVHLYHGASEYELPKILKNIKERCLFWLDGHYSAGDTALGETPCPLYLELDAISQHPVKDHIILIDDTRLFGSEWDHINMGEIQKKLLAINPNYTLSFEDGFIPGVKKLPNDILVAQIS